MYARVTTGQTPVERLDEGIAGWVAAQANTVGRPGFRGNMLLAERDTGRFQIIGLWDSREAMRSTAAAPGAWRELVEQGLLVGEPTIAIYEVASRNDDPQQH